MVVPPLNSRPVLLSQRNSLEAVLPWHRFSLSSGSSVRDSKLLAQVAEFPDFFTQSHKDRASLGLEAFAVWMRVPSTSEERSWPVLHGASDTV